MIPPLCENVVSAEAGHAGMRTFDVLGTQVSVLNLELAGEVIDDAIQRKQKGYVCVTGVHGVTEAYENPDFRQILNDALLVTPDGMPLVWLGRLHGFKEMGRVYGPDLMLDICRRGCASGYRHFLYGGNTGVAQELKSALETRFPGIQITGTFTPPFRPLTPDEETNLVEQVRLAKPDILWVGLSTPKQEKFMAEYLPKLDATVMIGVGAAFDFHTGRVKQAPRWMQRSGMEWFYRTLQEPRRLARRYFRNNPLFILRLLRSLF